MGANSATSRHLEFADSGKLERLAVSTSGRSWMPRSFRTPMISSSSESGSSSSDSYGLDRPNGIAMREEGGNGTRSQQTEYAKRMGEEDASRGSYGPSVEVHA